jgi:hypothetical protein
MMSTAWLLRCLPVGKHNSNFEKEGTVPVHTSPAHCDGVGITYSGVIEMEAKPHI